MSLPVPLNEVATSATPLLPLLSSLRGGDEVVGNILADICFITIAAFGEKHIDVFRDNAFPFFVVYFNVGWLTATKDLVRLLLSRLGAPVGLLLGLSVLLPIDLLRGFLDGNFCHLLLLNACPLLGRRFLAPIKIKEICQKVCQIGKNFEHRHWPT